MALSDRLKARSTEVIGNELFVVGDVKTSFLTLVQFQALMGPEWVLADGQDVTGSQYASITGLTVIPDCRGRFLRMEGTGSAALRGLQVQATAVNGLVNAASVVTGTTNIDHNHPTTSSGTISANHTHDSGTLKAQRSTSNGSSNIAGRASSTSNQGTVTTDINLGGSTGSVSANHTHATDLPALGTANISLASGSSTAQAITGDAETRPVNATVNYFIKIN